MSALLRSRSAMMMMHSKLLRASASEVAALCAVILAVAAQGTYAQQMGGTSSKQATLSVSAVVVPSCVLDTAPTPTGPTSVTMRCQSKDLSRVRVSSEGTSASATVDVIGAPGSPSITRTETVGGSLIHIDF